ncbi:hypothetical protein [Actinopolymorpha pittospori]|uniref:Uncharacterized protein n=1 Tax=Actinopolymorpha pittospori TaxID=648752 RepID=A0A927N4L0_9ACTN|nr:hypothetical protein [Actinopolymorpha pittospori]MBE1612251.1 hypothetical protein [Actinopolymorpha pittospori]
MSGGATYDVVGPETRARNVRFIWGPLNGYNIYAGSANVSYGFTVHNWSWHGPKYPGRWWTWAKGIKVQQTNDLLKYMSVESTPTDPMDAGWSTS